MLGERALKLRVTDPAGWDEAGRRLARVSYRWREADCALVLPADEVPALVWKMHRSRRWFQRQERALRRVRDEMLAMLR